MSEEPSDIPLPPHYSHEEYGDAWQQLNESDQLLISDPDGIIPASQEALVPSDEVGPHQFMSDEVAAEEPPLQPREKLLLESRDNEAFRKSYHIARRMFDGKVRDRDEANLTQVISKQGEEIQEKSRRINRLVEENNLSSKTLFELTRENGRQREEIERLTPLAEKAFVDDLTGIKNRRGLIEAFNQLVADHKRHARREGDMTAILFVDLDGFKGVNDNLGHKAGDQILFYVAQRFQARMNRAGDVVARLGGDEFVFLLPDTDLAGAKEIGESIRDIVRYGAGELDGKKTGLDISGGITMMDAKTDKGFDDLVEESDRALLYAKESGKGRFIVFNGVETTVS